MKSISELVIGIQLGYSKPRGFITNLLIKVVHPRGDVHTMKYYLCKIGTFQDGGEDQIKEHCLRNNIYQYYKWLRQKGAGNSIRKNDTLILVFKKSIIAYGISCGSLENDQGFSSDWQAVKVKEWKKAEKDIHLPYGVWAHTLTGNKQSVVKEIDALWANDLITQIISNSKELMPQTPVIHLHLPFIVSLIKKGFLEIPAVQRGKVWNAVRTEILWDSLLRNIPIGFLSIRSTLEEKRWQLLDGQQRSNAISLGYTDFNKENQAILWIDLGMSSAETEPNSYSGKQSSRKFFFRVTTQAHPWGYKLSDNEIKNETLNAREKREAALNSKPQPGGKRPLPFELWPVKAIFPVPFTLLRQFCERTTEPTFDEFWTFCQNKAFDTNWFEYFNKRKTSPNPRAWKELCKGISRLNTIIIVAQNASGIADEDVGLYFKRMNKAGVEPNDAEIRYSLIKSRIPELKKLDELAEQRMPPARMADIAMKTYFIIKGNDWKNNISNRDLRLLVQKDEFKEYVTSHNQFQAYIKTVEKWLLYDANDNPAGLPRFVYSSIARSNCQDIFSLLLYFAARGYKFDGLGRRHLIALATLVCWFGVNKSAMAANGYDIYQGCQGDWRQKTKQWLWAAVKNNHLLLPPHLSILQNIQTAIRKNNLDHLQQARNLSGYKEALNRIWHWQKKESRELLLYACREYLNTEFPDYDPVDSVWCEENRPWDYDHIFPQSWLISGQGNRRGPYHGLVDVFLNSIGNIAPLAFSRNREKNDTPPGKYLEERNNQLFVNSTDFFAQNNKYKLEETEQAFTFANITAERFGNLYSNWYKALNIESLLDFSGTDNKRKALYDEIKKRYPDVDVNCYYVAEGGRQQKFSEPANWARPWIAIGFECKFNQQNSLYCLASDEKIWEVGYRRHPDVTEIDGNSNKWWFECRTFNTDEEAISYFFDHLQQITQYKTSSDKDGTR